jgi:hypothetical protein
MEIGETVSHQRATHYETHTIIASVAFHHGGQHLFDPFILLA